MSTFRSDRELFRHKSALVVGVGGLGCPAALALVRAGVGRLVLADDDLVDETNLHRQILFFDSDIGADKLEAARRTLARLGPAETSIELVHSRFLPENARLLARSVDVVVEGADNFATKFLAADACYLERRPVVQGAGVRWTATAFAGAPRGAPCYRCLFEDLPQSGDTPNCAEAGVMGPVVGFTGALLADLALRVLASDQAVFGSIYTFDGLRDRLRQVPLARRPGCPLCGTNPKILDIDETRYLAPSYAA